MKKLLTISVNELWHNVHCIKARLFISFYIMPSLNKISYLILQTKGCFVIDGSSLITMGIW